jgi:hypothetical protein
MPDAFCQELFYKLDNLLGYIRRRYQSHFNDEEYIPDGYRILVGSDITRMRQKILPQIADLSIDSTMISILQDTIDTYSMVEKSPDTTYRQIFYTQMLLGKLSGYAAAKPVSAKKELHILLHQIDFNSHEYIRYCQDQITALIKPIPPAEKRKVLATFRALVIQASREDAEKLHPKAEPLSKAMLRWIDAELELAKVLQQEGSDPAAETPNIPIQTAARRDHNIPTTYSVSDLSYSARLLVDVGVIKKKHGLVGQLSRMIAACFSSVGTEEPSEASISRYYYNPNSKSLTQIAKTCEEILARIREMDPSIVKKKKK